MLVVDGGQRTEVATVPEVPIREVGLGQAMRRELLNDVDDLAARVAELEVAISSDDSASAESVETPSESAPTTPSHTRDAGEDAASGDESVPPVARDDVDSDLEVAYREYLDGRPPKKSHAKDIVVDALLLLREHGELETGDLQDELFSEYEEHYATDRTMWNAVSRYLKDLAGFEKTDSYGGWAYAGDDAVWNALNDES